MLRIVVLSLLATFIVPFASAECVGDVCVNQNSYGDGCESGAPDDFSMRGVSASSGSRTVYVTNACNVYNAEGYTEEGSSLAVGYYSFDEATGYQAAGVSWYGYTWNGNEECSYSVYSYGMAPLPDGGENVECLDGAPGMILP